MSARKQLHDRMFQFVGGATADEMLNAYRAEIEREVRWQVAEDFQRLGQSRPTDISWGEAYEIARGGLCSCNGGTQACPAGGESRG